MLESNQIKMRQATDEDVKSITELVHFCIDQTLAKDYDEEAIVFWKNHHSEKAITEQMADSYVVVMEIDGKLVGTGALAQEEVFRLFVSPDIKGHRLGATLLDFLEKTASMNDMTVIELECPIGAKSYFEQQGYQTEAVEAVEMDSGPDLEYFVMSKKIQEKPIGEAWF